MKVVLEMQRDGPNLQVYFGQEDGIGPSGWAGMQKGHGQISGMTWALEIHPAQPKGSKSNPTNDPNICVPNSFLWA